MIQLDKLTVHAGNFSLKDVSLEIQTGAYGVLMGKTGSGKTTILEAICGLKKVSSGSIKLGGEDVTVEKPGKRGIGYVPQDGALFGTMTVQDHLEFALRIRKMNHAAIKKRVLEEADRLGIKSLLDRTIEGLSGGEKQRVALGRAISFRPNYLCLDEPLSALDDATRIEICNLLQKIQQETGVTVLHITHNRAEAELLADQLLEIHNGQIICSK